MAPQTGIPIVGSLSLVHRTAFHIESFYDNRAPRMKVFSGNEAGVL
jgi:hypothetical protein